MNDRFRANDELLARCEQEPIHIPGAIQPHGVLVAVEPSNGQIVVASANAKEHLGIEAEDLLKTDIYSLLDCGNSARTLAEQLKNILKCPPVNRVPLNLGGRFSNMDTEIHLANEGRVIFEFERCKNGDANAFVIDSRADDLQQIRELSTSCGSPGSFDQILNRVATIIRNMTKYDRVMVYKIDSSGHGEVIAEAKQDHLEPFLGLHFPSTDIPHRARQLYLKNRVRHLADLTYQPVPLLPTQAVVDPCSLDLSLSHLRTFSPVHIEYLANMGVQGTLVISVIVDQKLWGLIACHHYSPLHISSQIRERCDAFAHMLSLLVDAYESRRIVQAMHDGQQIKYEMEQIVGSSPGWQKRFLEQDQLLLDEMQASGFVMVSEVELHGIGVIPDWNCINKIIAYKRTIPLSDVFQCESLSREIDGFPESPNFCGCLAVTVSQSHEFDLLWFRTEQAKQVNWAGDPRKRIIIDNGGPRLSPRKSFQKWTEMVRNESPAWDIRAVEIARGVEAYVSRRKIEDASRTKSQFLANMSHEIRTPLTAILGYTDILQNQIHCSQQSTMTGDIDGLGVIRRNAEHLLGIIDDILNMSQIEADRMVVNFQLVDVPGMLRDIAQTAIPTIGNQPIEFCISSATPIPSMIRTDQHRVRQILHSLISNSLRFTETGVVAIEVLFEDSKPGFMTFRVRDTGCGIEPSKVGSLFRPFVQADNSMSRKHGGTGLGLYLSRRFAELLHGQLNLVDTQSGAGTTFELIIPTGCSATHQPSLVTIPTIRFPYKRNAFDDSAEATDGSEVSLSGLRVLLAEDGLDNQRLLSHLLRKQGMSVVVVENGEQAVAAALDAAADVVPFDLILMDMQMPVMDGYEATRQLRIQKFDGPIVAVTAHALVGDRERCLAAGCDGFASKPVRKDALFSAIREVLAKWKQTQSLHRHENPIGIAGRTAELLESSKTPSFSQIPLAT